MVDRLGDGHAQMGVVAWLEAEHGLGHDDADAVVDYAKAAVAK